MSTQGCTARARAALGGQRPPSTFPLGTRDKVETSHAKHPPLAPWIEVHNPAFVQSQNLNAAEIWNHASEAYSRLQFNVATLK